MASITVPHALVGDSAPESQSLVNDRDLEVVAFSNNIVCSFRSAQESISNACLCFFVPGSKRFLSVCMKGCISVGALFLVNRECGFVYHLSRFYKSAALLLSLVVDGCSVFFKGGDVFVRVVI
jgi:hypothetical protein